MLDSAGGHGTKSQKYNHESILKHKTMLVYQMSQSPDTSIPDLGIWTSLQYIVPKYHRLKCDDKEVLQCKVMDALNQVTDVQAFMRVFDMLTKNYKIIRACSGDNN